MKNKITIIIAIILLIITAFLLFNNKKGTLKKEVSDFAIEDTASITKIFMADKMNNQVTLKRLDGYWTVNDKYIARVDLMKILLKTMKQIEVQSPVAKAAHNTVISRLAANSVKVEIYQTKYIIDFWGIRLIKHEKLSKVYYVGGATQNQQGTYMLLEGAKEPFITYLPSVMGFLTPRYAAKEIEWRERIIAKYRITDIRSIKLTYHNEPEKSFEMKYDGKNNISLFAINDNNRQLTNLNNHKLKNYISGFSKISLEAFLPDASTAEKDSIKKEGCIYTLSIKDKSGKIMIVNMYHKGAKQDETDLKGIPLKYDRDRMFAFINDDKDFIQIQYYEFDKILKPVSYFEK
ncbi:MAG: DUF4340 domain-containing protein [Bacteroidota bacterium]|nr:DUF4340 domain-containing protein [Bacteroidota bacterium]